MQTEELRAGVDRAEQRASVQLEGPVEAASPSRPASCSPDSMSSPLSTPLAAPERLFREPSASPAPTPPLMSVFQGKSPRVGCHHHWMLSRSPFSLSSNPSPKIVCTHVSMFPHPSLMPVFQGLGDPAPPLMPAFQGASQGWLL